MFPSALVLVNPKQMCDGLVHQSLLFDDVELLRPAAQLIFDLISDQRRCKQSPVWRLRWFIDLRDELPAIVTVDSLEREREVMLHIDDIWCFTSGPCRVWVLTNTTGFPSMRCIRIVPRSHW